MHDCTVDDTLGAHVRRPNVQKIEVQNSAKLLSSRTKDGTKYFLLGSEQIISREPSGYARSTIKIIFNSVR